MGTRIEAVATAVPGRRRRSGSSVALAVDAARQTLLQAGRRPEQIGMLIHAGVFRDGNVMEPANATFIQRRLGVNIDVASAAGTPTISFDLTNGTCGVLAGMQVVDGFVETAEVGHGLVVTSDIDPTPGVTEGFESSPIGAAVLLGPGEPGEGFEAFRSFSFPEHGELLDASVSWNGRRHALRVAKDEQFHLAALRCAGDALGCFLAEQGLRPQDVGLLVAAPDLPVAQPGFRDPLGLRPEQVLDVRPATGNSYTAGIAVAIEAAARTAAYGRAERVVFMAAGSGITVALASYRKQPFGTSASNPTETRGGRT